MNLESTDPSRNPVSIFRNWITVAGFIIMLGSLFSFGLLFVLDAGAHFSNPYIGILTYFVAPGFLMSGLSFAVLGAWLRRRKVRKAGGTVSFKIDFSRPRDRRVFGYFVAGSLAFLVVSAIGSYHTYHFTESVVFCGQACHTVMEPELVTYQHGAHARVACVQCHIGPGAEWFVKSKLSGSYQLYSVAFNKYPRPVPTPIKNLRPAQDTCEQCHWPQKFVGNIDRTYHYFLGDETNTPFSVRLTMKVGGAASAKGPAGGIHWHVGNKVEYVATDPSRQKIPWVRVTDADGTVTEYRTRSFTNDVAGMEVRTMDCMDCHNRPAHRFESPNDSVNLLLSLNPEFQALPWLKTNAVFALTRQYTNDAQALQNISAFLGEKYRGNERVDALVRSVQSIYTNNFFPEMKASWEKYPNNVGHKDWAGCFRCHDSNHKTLDGKQVIKANDCNTCHTILSQGSGAELELLSPNGQKFKHPGDEVDGACNDCHTGGL
jgi:nitrate/TMAO reductase-like tetraheme cytochrome c subunit